MGLLIMGLIEAVNYIPTTPTYAIRIQSATLRYPGSLHDSRLYTLREYTFDDIFPVDIPQKYKLFDEPIAQQIIADFRESGIDKDTLMIHCSRGVNRSPAVGMALNNIFNLGHDAAKLNKHFPEFNWHVYDTLLETAKKLKIY